MSKYREGAAVELTPLAILAQLRAFPFECGLRSFVQTFRAGQRTLPQTPPQRWTANSHRLVAISAPLDVLPAASPS